MRYFSFFTGVGGVEQGITQAYKNRNMPQAECVGFSEIDKFAISVYKRHFSNVPNFGDITKINPVDLPDFDMMRGGISCQPWSATGERKGFDDDRGKVWYDFLKIAKIKQPKIMIIENVKGLLTHNQGASFIHLMEEMCEMGYAIDFELINSKNFGVAQNRERVYIVAILQDLIPMYRKIQGSSESTKTPNNLKLVARIKWKLLQNDKIVMFQLPPLITKETVLLREILDEVVDEKYHISQYKREALLKTLNKPIIDLIQNQQNTTSKVGKLRQLIGGAQYNRVYDVDGISTTLLTGINKIGMYAVKPILTPDRLKKRQNGRRVKENNEPSFTLTTQDRHGVMICNTSNFLDGITIRHLTPTECENLQAFPVGWTEFGENGEKISDSQRYKMMGNAVTVNVVEAVMDSILRLGIDI